MLLMIDNYDSFTYNLVQYFFELGQDVEVYRNDEISLEDIKNKSPKYITEDKITIKRYEILKWIKGSSSRSISKACW